MCFRYRSPVEFVHLPSHLLEQPQTTMIRGDVRPLEPGGVNARFKDGEFDCAEGDLYGGELDAQRA